MTAEVKGNTDIWIWDFAEKNLARFTFADQIDNVGIWTPDGQRITFSSVRGVLRKGAYFSLIGHNRDIHPDGKRFLMIKSPRDE